MTSRTIELVAVPFRALRRATLWWSIGLAGLVAATVAFWPAFRGSTGISQALEQLPQGVIDAFGLRDFDTPAGYLRGNLYELFLPLLMSLAAVALANGQTASEEASGRLELFLAQPVDRRAAFLGRALSVVGGIAVITLVLIAAQFGFDALVDLRLDPGDLCSTIALCALLGLFHGAVAFAIACVRPRPALVVGVGSGVAIAGYVVAVLFPLSGVLAPWRHLSPWDWAFGGNPLQQATDPWRYAALAASSIVLTALGLVAVERRDVGAG